MNNPWFESPATQTPNPNKNWVLQEYVSDLVESETVPDVVSRLDSNYDFMYA